MKSEALKNKICQSCGMPLENYKNFGKNQDGSINNEYCNFCFKEGQFTDKNITMEQKIEKNILIAKKMGTPEDKARQMAENIIPKLKRWREISV